MQNVLRSRRTTEKSDESRPAEKGDGLLVDFTGRIDGIEFEGGSAKDAMVEIGSSQYVPGFEEQMIGMKPGDTRTIKITFPADYGMADKAGKDAEFDITVKELHKVTVPELNEEFAKSMGDENAEAMRTRLTKFLQENYDNASRMRLKRQLLDKLAEAYSFPVPQGLVDVEFDAIWKQMEKVTADGQLDPEDQGKSDEELRAEYRGDRRTRRVRLRPLAVRHRPAKNATSRLLRKTSKRQSSRKPCAIPARRTRWRNTTSPIPRPWRHCARRFSRTKSSSYIISQAKVTDQPATIRRDHARPGR